MRLNKNESTLVDFLQAYPNQWHSYSYDAKTRRAVGGLCMYYGTGKEAIEINREYGQIRLNLRIIGEGIKL